MCAAAFEGHAGQGYGRYPSIHTPCGVAMTFVIQEAVSPGDERKVRTIRDWLGQAALYRHEAQINPVKQEAAARRSE